MLVHEDSEHRATQQSGRAAGFKRFPLLVAAALAFTALAFLALVGRVIAGSGSSLVGAALAFTTLAFGLLALGIGSSSAVASGSCFVGTALAFTALAFGLLGLGRIVTGRGHLAVRQIAPCQSGLRPGKRAQE